MGIDGISTATVNYDPRVNAQRSSNASEKAGSGGTTNTERYEKDSVEISQQARDMLRESAQTNNETSSMTTAADENKAVQKSARSYTKEDLQDVKARLQELTKQKNKIYNNVNSVLEKKGIKLTKNDKLKLEIGSKGEILVGGVADAETAKAIEKALNEDKDLAKQIKKNRNEELSISGELEDITGMSLTSYKRRLGDVQNGRLDGTPFNMTTGEYYTPDELMRFEDQELFSIDPDFVDEISEYIAIDEKCDISTASNLLANPEEAMKGIVTNIIGGIKEAFEAENKKTLEDIKDLPIRTKEDQEWVDGLMMSLEDVDIQIDNDGNISIEGDAAEDSRKNTMALEIIEQAIKSTLQDNPVTGEKSDYSIATERLVNLYEDQFALYGSDATAVSSITGGNVLSIESHISNPEREAELNDEIKEDVNAALEKMGLQAGLDLDVEIDDDGKIVIANMPEDEKLQQQISQLVDVLNAKVEIASPNKDDASSLEGLVGRIRANIDESKVYKPGGARDVQKAFKEEYTEPV